MILHKNSFIVSKVNHGVRTNIKPTYAAFVISFKSLLIDNMISTHLISENFEEYGLVGFSR